jgi:RNA polymerase sigma-70 factor (ECF subfamily)
LRSQNHWLSGIALQEICLTYEGRAKFRTWLFRIALRESQKANAKVARRDRHRSRLTALEDEVPSANLSDRVVGRVDLASALEQLAPDERAALLMCDGYGFTNREAANALGVPLGTAKSFVRRSRKRVRDFLETGND